MSQTYKNGSHLEKIGQTAKIESHLEKWVTPKKLGYTWKNGSQ